MHQKYTRTSIQNTGKAMKYLFFWGHQPNRRGEITESCLSHWWNAAFTVDGHRYNTAEHFMMAEKARIFGDHAMRERILRCASPAHAKKLGRQVEDFHQEVWESKRFEIVFRGNYHKFSQHPEMREFLLKSRKRVLVEASPVDKIWGIGLAKDHDHATNPQKWRGLNLLGFALMQVRDELKK